MLRTITACRLPDDPLDFPTGVKRHKTLRLMNHQAKLTLLALWDAGQQAQLDFSLFAPTRAVVVGVGNYDPLRAELDEALAAASSGEPYERLRHNLNPLWLLKVLPNMPAAHFAILTKSGGPNHSVANGSQARCLAEELIRHAEADTVLCADLSTATAHILLK